MGSKEGIMHISMAFLNPGDKVLIPNPGYPTYQSVARLLEAEPVFYNLKATNDWQPDLEDLSQMDLNNVKICGSIIPTCQRVQMLKKTPLKTNCLGKGKRHSIGQ